MNINVSDIRNFIVKNADFISESVAQGLAKRLSECGDGVRKNVEQWICGSPFSDEWIRDKYSINAVLIIRGNPKSVLAVADAIIALDNYRKDESLEFAIWQKRM